MATRSTRSNRSGSSTGGYSRYDDGESYRDDMRGGARGDMGGGARKGIRVKAEMANPRVARITIEVNWQQLASKVARKVGRRIKARQARRSGSTRGSGSTRRTSSSRRGSAR